MTEYYYRADETFYSAGVDDQGDPLPGPGRILVSVWKYKVHHHTSKGVVLNEYSGTRRIFINNSWNKKFAHPTVDAALESLIKRRERMINIYIARTRNAALVIKMAERMRRTKELSLYDDQLSTFEQTDGL